METGRCSAQQSHLLLAELNQMREQVMELSAHLGQASLSEFCKLLAPKLLSSLEKSMSMAKTTTPRPQQQQRNSMVGVDSPRVGSRSPTSDNSDTEFRKDMSKKRKTLPKWTRQVRLTAGADGGMDDGHSWRKYGQKVILGAKHPRGYFRCTHRYTQSCKATKQVQRSDEDPLLFDVTYHGTHSCTHKPQPAAITRHVQQQALKPQTASQQLLQSFQMSLRIKTEGDSPVSSSFEANQVACNGGADAILDNAFCSPTTPDNCFTGAPCASLFSPTTTPESPYFGASPFRASSFQGLQELNSSGMGATWAAAAADSSPEAEVDDLSFLQFDFPLDLGLFDDEACLFP